MNNYTDYLKKQTALREHYRSLSELEIYKSSNATRNALVSANKYHYLGEGKNDISFFKEYLYHNEMADVDLLHFPIIASKIIVNNESGLLLNQSLNNTIFCTFHIGSYRVVPLLLTYLKLNIGLPVDENTYNQQHTWLANLHRNVGVDLGELQLINVEKAAAGFQMVSKLKSNANLIFYVDGNTGVNAEQLSEIPFLKNRMMAKQGIALLSYSLKAKIVPVFTYRANEEIYIDFLKPIVPSDDQVKGNYVQQTTATLYNTFKNYLLQYPEQWEGWAYSHQPEMSIIEKPDGATIYNESGVYVLNKDRFIPILSGEENYFFDKHTFLSLRIPDKYEALIYEILKRETVSIKYVSAENAPFYKNLFVNNILI